MGPGAGSCQLMSTQPRAQRIPRLGGGPHRCRVGCSAGRGCLAHCRVLKIAPSATGADASGHQPVSPRGEAEAEDSHSSPSVQAPGNQAGDSTQVRDPGAGVSEGRRDQFGGCDTVHDKMNVTEKHLDRWRGWARTGRGAGRAPVDGDGARAAAGRRGRRAPLLAQRGAAVCCPHVCRCWGAACSRRALGGTWAATVGRLPWKSLERPQKCKK